MASIIEPARSLELIDGFDVVVAGGGTAGIVAAVAAARNGARVMLTERSGFIGGTIATQLLEHSAGWFDAGGVQIVRGLPQEVVTRLVEAGASPGHVRDDTGYTRMRVPVNHEAYKSIVVEWVAEAGVELRLFSPVCSVVMDGDRLRAVIVENKSGRIAYAARAVVDCTGDADVAALAGCEMLSDGTEPTQPVSMLFKLGGIDFSRLIDHVDAHADDFKLGVAPAALRGEAFVNLWGFGALLRRAHADGVLSFQRGELHFAGEAATGEAVVNLTRHAADGTRAEELGRAEIVLRRQVMQGLRFFRGYVPGCEAAYLSATAAAVGVRETRRIRGICELGDDDVRAGRQFDDAVALGGFPIDSHDPRGPSMDGTEPVRRAYGIPYRALVPARVDGLIVAGRCISAGRRALASARITGTCMAMGQAAGTAAALAATSNAKLRDLDVGRLRAVLEGQGVVL